MTLIFITTDDLNGYFNNAANTDVYVKAGVLLGSQDPALQLSGTSHDVTVQGAIVSGSFGIDIGPSSVSTVGNCTLAVAEGGLIAGSVGARLVGSGNHVTNHGDIIGQGFGLALTGIGGTSTVENFGLISAEDNAFSVGDTYTQALILRNTGEISGGDLSYVGSGGTDTVVNRGVMDGAVLLNSGDDIYKGGLGALDGSISGGSGNDRIICGQDDDSINGGLGKDNLTGGAGQDHFLFSDALGTSNVDRIIDFSAAADTIRLDKSIFTTLNLGTLAAASYKDIGDPGATVDANDRILYNDDTGALYYDTNGSAAGGLVQFAMLDNEPATLTAADFFVVV